MSKTYLCKNCGDESKSPRCDCLFSCSLSVTDEVLIARFCREVNRKAEAAMLKTGKLEGAHHAAMKQVCERLGVKI